MTASASVVWVVTGSVGEYSDRIEWPAKAFHNEDDARAFVEKMDALGREWWSKWSGDNLYTKNPTRDAHAALIGAEEPGWGEDYSGPAIYTATAVPLIPQPAEQDAREAVASPGGWLIKDYADGWLWTPTRIAAVAALTEGHAVIDLAALTQAAPDGWVLVPVEPTEAMLVNGREAILPIFYRVVAPVARAAVRGVWKDMLSASPAPPAQGAGG